jgi:hypothetical protein
MRLNTHFVPRLSRIALLLSLSTSCAAQQPAGKPTTDTTAQSNASNAIQVNWLYGAYLPRNVKLVKLTPHQRKQLYLRQTYLTWGIYFKTAAFSLADQASNSPMEWGGGIGAYGKRFASRFGQFAIQNTFSATGNYLLGYEPRYERCRCSGLWPRVRHALIRNLVTYNSTEQDKRPQIALYASAMGAGMIASTWSPERKDVWRSGYQSVLTQVMFGSAANVVGEFAPEITRLLHRGKQSAESPHP